MNDRRIAFAVVVLLGSMQVDFLSAQTNETPHPLLRADSAVQPQKVMQLFNGKDFEGLYHYHQETKYEDPRGVFSVQDGMIRMSGDGNGYVATKQAYKNYRLLVEYKWGARPEKAKYVRNSGILLHGVGPDGANSGGWMTTIECQLAQGCNGDFILIRGKDEQGQVIRNTITAEVELGPDKRPRWKPGGEKTVYSGRQFWWSKHDPTFKELIDTRGKDDVESPLGEWTRVECVCRNDRITVSINGVAVNECFDVKPAGGKILLQCEGFEIFFRKFELHPLPESTP